MGRGRIESVCFLESEWNLEKLQLNPRWHRVSVIQGNACLRATTVLWNQVAETQAKLEFECRRTDFLFIIIAGLNPLSYRELAQYSYSWKSCPWVIYMTKNSHWDAKTPETQGLRRFRCPALSLITLLTFVFKADFFPQKGPSTPYAFLLLYQSASI